MAKRIEDLLHRRADLSTFLVHLTRASPDGGATALQNLQSMIESMEIEARTPYGPAQHLDSHLGSYAASQKAVCMTETPLEHIWMMLEEIENRTVNFEPYGLAITKTTGRKAGFNPVWYSDISRIGVDWPIKAVNEMVSAAVERATSADGEIDDGSLCAEPIFQITPFFEQMGPTQGGLSRKEFWWEREWRKAGSFYMSFPSRVVALLAPEHDHGELRAFLQELSDQWGRRPVVDPRWGLERMIVALSGVPDAHAGPFPAYGP